MGEDGTFSSAHTPGISALENLDDLPLSVLFDKGRKVYEQATEEMFPANDPKSVVCAKDCHSYPIVQTRSLFASMGTAYASRRV